MDFLSKSLKKIFKIFGLLKKEGTVILAGLDNAGKASLMSLIQYNEIRPFDPTLYTLPAEVKIGDLEVKSIELGGLNLVLKVWRDYYPKVDAIIYLMDAADPKRFSENRKEFEGIVSAPGLGNIPILLLGNKIDKVITEFDILVQFIGDQSHSSIFQFFP